MKKFDCSMSKLSGLLLDLPKAFGIDIKIRAHGALILATVSNRTPDFIPYDRCRNIERRDNLEISNFGEFVEDSTCLYWSDVISSLQKHKRPFEIVIATKADSGPPLTRGLFLVFDE